MSDRDIILGALQATITRLSGYAFQAKGWAITVASGFIATAISLKHPTLLTAAALPCLFFWWLDAYFLMLERRFRWLFFALLADPQATPTAQSFDHRSVAEQAGFAAAASAGTVAGFYLALLLGVAAIGFLSL